MKYKDIFQKVKDITRKTAVGYAVLGNLYMLSLNETGHPSADHYFARNPVAQESIQERETTGHVSSDIFLGKAEPTGLERAVLDVLIE